MKRRSRAMKRSADASHEAAEDGNVWNRTVLIRPSLIIGKSTAEAKPER